MHRLGFEDPSNTLYLDIVVAAPSGFEEIFAGQNQYGELRELSRRHAKGFELTDIHVTVRHRLLRNWRRQSSYLRRG